MIKNVNGVDIEMTAAEEAEFLASLPGAPPLPIPSVSRRQFFQQAAISGIITEDEALAAVTTGALPGAITTFISALPAEQQFGAKMLFSVNEFQRSSPMANAFGQAIGMTPAQIDDFFTAAAAL